MDERPVSILLLAAGSSRRMVNRDKLIEKVHGGTPLIVDRVKTCLAAQPFEVVVTLRASDPIRRALLTPFTVHQVPVSGAAMGISASIKAGLTALSPRTEGAMIVLADMPDLTSADFRKMIDTFQTAPKGTILRAGTEDHQPGNPVLFGRERFASLLQITGDEGARVYLATHNVAVQLVPLPAHHAQTDLDTPQDWARWRQFN